MNLKPLETLKRLPTTPEGLIKGIEAYPDLDAALRDMELSNSAINRGFFKYVTDPNALDRIGDIVIEHSENRRLNKDPDLSKRQRLMDELIEIIG